MNDNTNTRPKEKMSLLKKLLIVLAFVGVFGGQILGFGLMLDSFIKTLEDYRYQFDYYSYDDNREFDGDVSHQFNSSDNENSAFRDYFDFSYYSNESITEEELATLKTLYYSNQSIDNSIASPGIYHVGQDLDPGTYYIAGTRAEEYVYFILSPSSQEGTFDVAATILFEGFTLAQLKEGQVFICDNQEGFTLRDNLSLTYSSPYGPGLYEVGRDIPEGTYHLNVPDDGSIYGYFIWNDLLYTDESLLEGAYEYGPNQDISIELKEGTYVELCNASLTTNSKKVYV